MKILRSLRTLLHLVVCGSLGSLAHAGGVRILQQPGLGTFPTLQSAVAAAFDDQTLLVANGTYGGMVIDGKALRVLAVQPGGVQITGTVEVRNLASGQTVVLSGLTAVGATASGVSKPGLKLLNDAGHVRLQSCTFTGGVGASALPIGGAGGHGVDANAATRVVFAGCTVTGGEGFENDNCLDCSSGLGGDGAHAVDSSLAFYDCTVTGGAGGFALAQGGEGGNGAWASNYGLFASGTSFTGGDGGVGFDWLEGLGGDGGDGVHLTGAQAQFLDVVLKGGLGGKSWTSPTLNGLNGAPTSGSGLFNHLPGLRRKLSAPTIAADSMSLPIDVIGEPGDRLFVITARAPNFLLAKPLGGVWCVPLPFALTIVPLGTVPPSGVLSVALPLPDVKAPSVARTLFLQGFCIASSGTAILASPLHVETLDAAGSPDCNGNGRNDNLDLVAAAPDCNANLELDSCEIAGGTTPDCNGNGIPDACDIASGLTPDLNGNGVPDPCEPIGLTWYVDAAAAPGGNGSQAAPYRMLTEAFGVALSGHTIVMADGLYLSGNYGIDFNQRDIVLKSANGPAACVIDCQSGWGFRFHQGETPAARIEGLTIRNASSASGAAVRAHASSPTIINCVFELCNASMWGGAVYLFNSHSRVVGCRFVRNHAPEGGGLYATLHSARVVKCHFEGNSAGIGGGMFVASPLAGPNYISGCTFVANSSLALGGGIYVTALPSHALQIDTSLFAGNVADEGGAIAGQANLTLSGCTIVGNRANSVGGGVHRYLGGKGTLTNSILWGNMAPSGPQIAVLGGGATPAQLEVRHCDVQGGQAQTFVTLNATLTWGPGNLDLDPRFVDPLGPDGNPLTFGDNDYRLLLVSPCIDAADNTAVPPDRADLDGDGDLGEPVPVDLLGLPRFTDVPSVPDTGVGAPPVTDMGSYERQP